MSRFLASPTLALLQSRSYKSLTEEEERIPKESIKSGSLAHGPVTQG